MQEIYHNETTDKTRKRLTNDTEKKARALTWAKTGAF